jgi:hypothetical protein
MSIDVPRLRMFAGPNGSEKEPSLASVSNSVICCIR